MSSKKIWKKVSKESTFMLKVVGHRLLVKPLDAGSKESNIELLADTQSSDQRAQVYGEVLQVGSLCFADLTGETRTEKFGTTITHTTKVGDPWCEVGDVILYHPYAYQQVRDPLTMEYRDDYIVVNDQDVLAVVYGVDAYKDAINALKEAEEKEAAEKAQNLKSRW